MVYEIVDRMPEFLRANLESLCLDWHELIDVACQIRTAADGVSEDAVQGVMEELGATALGQQILKNTVIRTTAEVQHLHRCQATWINNMEARLDRLMHSADIADQTQRKLLSVEAQLAAFGSTQIAKARQVLMTFAMASDEAMTKSVFSGWFAFAAKEKGEKEIRLQLEKEIEEAEIKLMKCKEQGLATVKNVLQRQTFKEQELLLSSIMDIWQKEASAAKKAKQVEEEMKGLNEKLTQFSKDHIASAKRVVSRMATDQDCTLVSMAFGGWLKFSADYKKDKEFEDAVKASEKKIAEAKAKKNQEAMIVIETLNVSMDSGLQELVFSYWVQILSEVKRAREIEAAMDGAGGKLRRLKMRYKDNAVSVQSRVNDQTELNLLLKVVAAWAIESKVNRVDKYYTQKIESKRKQLASVQTLFKTFARDLETGLKDVDGDSSGRGSRRSKSSIQGLSRDGGSVSLPNIHAKIH